MAFFKYSLLRLVLFAAFFTVFMLLNFSPLTSAVFGVLGAFVVSYLFFRKQRAAATAVIAERFAPQATTTLSERALADADAEDALVEENPGIRIDSDRAPRKHGTA
ncbi:DUF4229 domain-containing protein [Specibacter cremeus]|uniref:DUF4229 domain-containing protein n=1 Tax=Specibacter cremeus TaxID=1629051 RepID=UPI000F79898C|nr:DUF4229 domain-containing protein [Specibacter cremeus]